MVYDFKDTNYGFDTKLNSIMNLSESDVIDLLENLSAEFACILKSEGLLTESCATIDPCADSIAKVYEKCSTYEQIMEASVAIFNEAKRAKTLDDVKAQFDKVKDMKFTNEDNQKTFWKFFIGYMSLGATTALVISEVLNPAVGMALVLVESILTATWMKHNNKLASLNKINYQCVSVAKKYRKKMESSDDAAEKKKCQDAIDGLEKISAKCKTEIAKINKDAESGNLPNNIFVK